MSFGSTGKFVTPHLTAKVGSCTIYHSRLEGRSCDQRNRVAIVFNTFVLGALLVGRQSRNTRTSYPPGSIVGSELLLLSEERFRCQQGLYKSTSRNESSLCLSESDESGDCRREKVASGFSNASGIGCPVDPRQRWLHHEWRRDLPRVISVAVRS
jgi:hypothetical protein